MDANRRFVFLAVVLSVFLLSALFFNVFDIDPARLGLSPPAGLLLLGASLLGSVINLPIRSRGTPAPGERRFPWIGYEPAQTCRSVLAFNLGGALIPLGLATYLLPRVALLPTLPATLLIAASGVLMTRARPVLGVIVPAVGPALLAAGLALLLARASPAPVAYVSGVAGTLIGAGLFNLPRARERPAGVWAIGGPGVCEAVLLVAIVAVCLT